VKITAILASFNRRDRTLRAIGSLLAQGHHELALHVVLADDRSSDGTAEAVRTEYPSVEVIETSGDRYWAASMHLADEVAWAGKPEAVLWLNDDVVLDPDALGRLLEVHAAYPAAIVGGAMRDPQTGQPTYGGYRQLGRHPLRTVPVPPAPTVQHVDLLNGNLLLVPARIRSQVGPVDGGFAHAYADFDYCARARKRGFAVLLAAGTFGECPRNPPLEATGRWGQLKRLHSPKGSPPRSQIRYLSRHGGAEWPMYLAGPYLRILANRPKRP
jgi:GT2 family glycosyltransferase